MKLVYIHQFFKTPSESGGTRSYDLAKAFVKRGIEVHMITTSNKPICKTKGRIWTTVLIDGINVHYMFLPYDNTFSYFKRILAFVKFLFFSTVKVLSLRCDLVLASSTPLTIGIPAMLKRWVHGTPYIFEVRDVWPEAVIAIGAIRNKIIYQLLYFLEFIIYKYAFRIVPLSTDMEESISQRYPKLKVKIEEVVENIAEIERFRVVETSRFNIEDLIGFTPKVSILYAGTFGRVNHIDYVIDLAKEVSVLDPSIAFILVGDGSEKSKLIELAKKYDVFSKSVFFLESFKKDELNDLYSIVNIGSSFVAPIKELWANSANKFFDTLAAGKPILINHGGWQAKLIEDEDIGYVLPVSPSKDDVGNFVKYLQSSSLNEQGDKARRVAESMFSLEVATNKYLRIINQINVS